MKFFTFLVSALAIAQIGFAQKDLAQIELSAFKFPMKTIDRITPALDDAGGACFSLEQEHKINFVVVGPAGEVVMPGRAPLLLGGTSNMIGATSTAERYTYFMSLREGDGKVLLPYVVEKATGEAIRVRSIELAVEKDSRFVTKVVEGNIIYLFFFQKKNNLLQMCILKDLEDITIQNFTVDIPKASSFFHLGDIFTPRDWTYLKQQDDKTFLSTSAKTKIYKTGNKITFVYDRFNYNPASTTAYFTQLVSLDLQAEQVTARTFSFLAGNGDYNTYLHHDKLFKFSVTPRDMKLEVFDVSTKELVRNHSYAKNEPIAIKASPLYIKDPGSFQVEENETTDSGVLLRKLAKGTPVVTVASANAGTLALKIGSYLVPSSGGGGMMMPMGGGSFATPGGPVSVAPTLMYLGGSSYGSGHGISTYFNAYLDATTLESVKATPVAGEQEMLEQFARQLHLQDVKVGATAIVKGESRLLYTYVDKKAKQLKVVKFGN